jgi:site-specific DNA recombinase
LSPVTDVTPSPERQRVSISQWAAPRGDEVVAWAEDLDVSGAVSPFARPQLGPWLTDASRLPRFDGIVAVRADRLTRRMFDLSDVLRWCETEKKTLATVDGFGRVTTL